MKLSQSMIPATCASAQYTEDADDADADADADGDDDDDDRVFPTLDLNTGRHDSDCTRASHS